MEEAWWLEPHSAKETYVLTYTRKIGCIHFNNLVMRTQKRTINLILRHVYKKSFFEPFRPGLSKFQKKLEVLKGVGAQVFI